MNDQKVNKEKAIENVINDFLASEELEMEINQMFHGSLYRFEGDDRTDTYTYAIPGAEKKDIKLVPDGSMLRLTVGGNSLFRGIKDVIWCSEQMDIDNTRAKYKDGILTVIIPKILKKLNKDTIEIE